MINLYYSEAYWGHSATMNGPHKVVNNLIKSLEQEKINYAINEEKYAQLEADTVLQFHKEGISMAINALLLSLRQYNRLVQLTQSFDDPAMKVGIKLDNSL